MCFSRLSLVRFRTEGYENGSRRSEEEMGKYEDNLELIKKAVRCEPVDRVPFVPCANAYMARANGIQMKEYINNFELACEANLKELNRIDADGTQNVIFSPYLLGTQWLSKTAIPGVDLGDDDMWQVVELPENMKFEDYQKIKKPEGSACTVLSRVSI